jgi:hypothetical protein
MEPIFSFLSSGMWRHLLLERFSRDKQSCAELVKEFPTFYGNSSSLPYSQELSISPYPNPDKLCPHPDTISLRFVLTLSSRLCLNAQLFYLISPLKICGWACNMVWWDWLDSEYVISAVNCIRVNKVCKIATNTCWKGIHALMSTSLHLIYVTCLTSWHLIQLTALALIQSKRSAEAFRGTGYFV